MKSEYSIDDFIKTIKTYPILSREEEKEIFVKAKLGDMVSRDKLINSNLLLIVQIAYEYQKCFQNIMDLVQEGSIGALRAFAKFDPDKGYRFTTYLGWWARAMILKYIFDNSHMIKPGTSNEQKKLFYNLRKEQKRLEYLGIEADAATIAKNLDVSEEDVIDMDTRLCNDIYLSAKNAKTESEFEVSIIDTIASPSEQRPDNSVENNEFRHILRNELDNFALKLKNDRSKFIFYKRIVAEDPLTLQSMANDFGLTRERVRQVEEGIIVNLKKYLHNFNEANQ